MLLPRTTWQGSSFPARLWLHLAFGIIAAHIRYVLADCAAKNGQCLECLTDPVCHWCLSANGGVNSCVNLEFEVCTPNITLGHYEYKQCPEYPTLDLGVGEPFFKEYSELIENNVFEQHYGVSFVD
eukprot:CAMPEP_0118942256 /NCGR_PEP_ID=MMETSP1169-20130426/35805_1 /TAXON_ID=36882 /ORGANISM="Pyramimonas obovata, Strain CCMP722" /LENGTH=125 /DNA_ID=CAMNT_0006887243 /DNA_START=44 /DNA_END=418 /DNA_ORIENTATION=+